MSFSHTIIAHPDYRPAHRRGWLWDEPASCWRPQEEPITPPPGTPRPGRIELVLRSVRFGWVSIEVRTADAVVEVLFDDVQDSFVPVVRVPAYGPARMARRGRHRPRAVRRRSPHGPRQVRR